MAFFKFRKGGDEHAAAPSASAPESLETLRKRARHRLIGAAVLVLLGVIGFPLLFDSQPRPIAVDITIEIPDKNKVPPLHNTVPVASAAGGVTAKAPAAPTPPPVASASQAAAPASRLAAGSVSPQAMITEVDPKPAPKADAKPISKPVEKVADKVAEKPTEKAATKPPAQESSKVPAATEPHDGDKKAATAEGRFVVQVGAFSDATKARDARVKLEKAGLKTYTQVIEAKEGRRIRVRVGPFATKHDAEKAAEKIKKLDLPTGVLEL